MVRYYVYAKDYSASTRGVTYYHQNGLNTLAQFKKDVEQIESELLSAGELPTESKVIYLHWGHDCVEVDEDLSIFAYKNLNGSDPATRPDVIIHWLKNKCDICCKEDKIKLLYIITDGLIDRMCAEQCFKLNENMHYEIMVFHAFNEQLRSVDLSVAASFFKSQCTVYRNNQLYDKINIAEAFNYDKINVSNYETEIKELKSYIKLKFIKNFGHDSAALKEIDKIKKLRDRLFNELSSKEVESEINLETKDKNVFLREFIKTNWYKNLTAPAFGIKVDIEKCTSTLINYIVNDAKSYSFDALKFEKNYDKAVAEEPVVDVNFPPEQEIEFPDVIMDDDKGIPVIILTEFNVMSKIIFHNNTDPDQVSPASFSKFKSTSECPLYLVNDQDMSASVGYFYTLNVYTQLLASDIQTDPHTRRPFRGGLVLTDTDVFDKYNDYILSATYFGCKKINYNVGLFYFVLWKNCESKEWMDRNVVEQFKRYTMRRISETVCKIGLSSLPLDPQENTSLLTALWYCVELSSCIFKNDPLLFKHERLRGYSAVAHHMIEILKYFSYDLDLEAVGKRTELIRNVMTLKRIDKHRDKVYYFLQKIFKTVNGFLVSEIQNPYNIYKLNYLKLNHKDMFRDDVVEGKVHLNDYVHLMHVAGDVAAPNTFDICDKTCRPFFTIDQNKSFYTDLVRHSRKVVIHNDHDKDKMNITYEAIDSLELDKILSLYKLFIDCVIDFEKYPTLSEYIEYISKKKKFYGELVNIYPANIHCGAKNVFERYQQLAAKVEIREFIRVSKSYVSRAQRVKAEGRLKSTGDNEISNFISREEMKVKLIKRT